MSCTLYNRHLDYFHKLKKIFGNCATVATNNKFVVLKAVKVRKLRCRRLPDTPAGGHRLKPGYSYHVA